MSRDALQLKTLLKKQLRELVSGYNSASKKGKRRSPKQNLTLLAFTDLLFTGMMFMMLMPMAQTASADDAGWVYFFIVKALAFALGILGGAAAAYAAFYKARDNDLLFALPVRPGIILLSRVASVYVLTSFFQLMILLPGFVNWMLQPGRFNVPVLIAALLTILTLPLLSLAVSGVLAFVIAQIAARVRVRSKTTLTTIAGLAFFAIYFVVYFRLSGVIRELSEGMAVVAGRIRAAFPPAVWIGEAALGRPLQLLAAMGAGIGLFALVYGFMARSFLRLSTTSRAAKKVVYDGRTAKSAGVSGALVRKELRRLRSSSTYMLNCCFSSVLMLALGVALFVRPSLVSVFTAVFEGPGMSVSAIFAVFITGALSATNYISAPSVSLEGRSLWLTRTLPVPVKAVLRAKLAPHMVATAPPAALCAAAVCYAFEGGAIECVLAALWAVVFTAYCACADLSIGVAKPMLDWVSEAQAVKQGIAGLLAMLANFAGTILCAGFAAAGSVFLSGEIGAIAAIIAALLLTLIAYRSLMKTGVRRFTALT